MAALIPPTRLTVVFPNYKMNPRLCGNTRGSAYLKREAQRQAKTDGLRLSLDALSRANTWAGEFLTHDGEYTKTQALPLKVICRRVYSGHSRLMDTENCLMGFKYFLDGLSAALGVNDRDFSLELDQVRQDSGGHRLELEIIPAWSVEKREKEGAA